jgi:UDP-2-acetamido-3-amino-2,3-dideoxy-glucuronate N-acetyltransferase
MTRMNKIAIIGIGNWGKNLVRDFSKISDIKKCTSNGSIHNIKWLKKNYPSIDYVNNYKEIFNDEEIDAVVISTPIKTHYRLVKKALLSKKHVFIEKPLCSKVSEAKELIQIAKKNNVFLFVGHIFLFNEVLKKIIQISKKEKIMYIEFNWNKFGSFDEDIFLNLLSHDMSIILKLFGKPKKINLQSSFGFVSKLDIVKLNVKLPENQNCEIYLNRYSNEKEKIVKIFTEKNVYHWNDLKLYKNNKKSSNFKLIYESKLTPLEIESKFFMGELNKSNYSLEYANLAKNVIQLINEIK